MQNIECEIRSFVTEQQYRELIAYFNAHGQFLGEDEQVTYYFDSDQDLRIQKNTQFSKIWLKKGKLHDQHREEIEVRLPKEDFEKLEHLFLALGYAIQIKWFRTRHSFAWGDITVAVDHTKGYGYILELEKMADESKKEATVASLKEKFKELHIPITSKEEFDRQYQHYKAHWQELT